jgi:two-component system cell cycle sensor histidine kinase/response regulator CckA
MTRVLIVDDKQENLYYLTALLEGHGCEVVSAHNGVAALAVAAASPPDFVISDLLMPVMDGYTLLRHWKADEALRRAPFIVYTATYTDPDDERLARDLGADAFILKPTEPEDFLTRFDAVRSRTGVTHPVPVPTTTAEIDVSLLHYNETLIRKLEEKTLQLEASNRQLQKDIAAREVAEAAREESEALLRQVAENIDDVFWLSDASGQRFYYVSPAYEVVWGRSCQSLLSQPDSWFEAIHAEDRERMRQSLPHQASGGWDESFRIVRPSGKVRWIRARAYPVRDATEVVVRMACVLRDVTEYRGLEEQLRQAQKMEAIGRLAGGVAHDFNNLLSVILSYASLILDDAPLGGALQEDVEEIRRAGMRATELTRQLLAFSRQQVLQPKALDLGHLVANMEKLLRRLVGEDVELELVTALRVGNVHADQSQVEQILMNLAVNARDAMPLGGKLTIETADVDIDASGAADRPDVAPGRYVLLAVTDSGTGMDATTIERIFEPFFTTKEQGKGTGLGLATVFGIVKQSRGHIDVESQPGVGTTFKVYLPSTRSPAVAEGRTLPALAALGGSETILLVEDDEQVRTTNSAILRRKGYRVVEVADGSAALHSAETLGAEVHLLLTDVVMPRMSGPQLAACLAPSRPKMKVLFLSGYPGDSIAHHGVLEPGVEFLQKPTTPESLLRRVREVLGKA